MLTLTENITLSMDLSEVYNASKSRKRSLELLRLVEIEDHANKLPSQISGGQQQRVAIARALANNPPVLVGMNPRAALILLRPIVFSISLSISLAIRAKRSSW